MANHVYREIAGVFCSRAKELGFIVYLAEKGTYGFITDEKQERVLSFTVDFSMVNLSGNYEPQPNIGTGWCVENDVAIENLTEEHLHNALYEIAPRWAVKDAQKKVEYTTVAQHLKRYQSSSQYRLYDENKAA